MLYFFPFLKNKVENFRFYKNGGKNMVFSQLRGVFTIIPIIILQRFNNNKRGLSDKNVGHVLSTQALHT